MSYSVSMQGDEMYTKEEFFGKIEFEGGIVEALVYGLKSADCEPGDARNLWEKLETAYSQLDPLVDEFYDLMYHYVP